MTTITILPEKADSYRALAGEKESTGRTAGEALDALTAQLGADEGSTLVIVQSHRPDKFFDAGQQERLTELMELHEAGSLSSEEERELESLVEAELTGARERAEALAAVTAQWKEQSDAFPYSYERLDAEVCVEPRNVENIVETLKAKLAEDRRTSAALAKEVRALPEEVFEILTLYLEGKSVREIADALNIPAAVAAYTLQKAQARLRYRLKQLSQLEQNPTPSSTETEG